MGVIMADGVGGGNDTPGDDIGATKSTDVPATCTSDPHL